MQMPKYIVQYEVIGYIDIEVEANSINEALASPTDRLTPSDASQQLIVGDTEWDWTPQIVYTKEGERVYG